MRAGFPHSDICGSMLVCQLPAAFRRLPRPSSPVIAKASTTCTYSLDPITLRPRGNSTPKNKATGVSLSALVLLPSPSNFFHGNGRYIQSKPSHTIQTAMAWLYFFRIVKDQNSPWLFKKPEPSKRPHSLGSSLSTSSIIGGGERDRTDDPLLAKQVLSQLSYTPARVTGDREQVTRSV